MWAQPPTDASGSAHICIVTNAFVLSRASRAACIYFLSVTLSRFATRCGRTVAMPSPRFSLKNENLKNKRLVRFFADIYDVTEPI